MTEEPRPGTTASVEKRVERVETKVDNLELRVVGIERDLAHGREVLGLRLDALSKGQDAVSAQITGLAATLSTAQLEGSKMLGDPEATPAGRQIVERIAAADAKATAADLRAATAEKRMAYIAGGVAVIVFAIQILTPLASSLARAMFGLP